MAEPDRPPGHRSLFDFGVRRLTETRPTPEVDRAEVERDVEAKRQARKQREQDAAAAAAAAKRPVGRPFPWSRALLLPQQLVWVRFLPGAPAGGDIALDIGLSAPQPQPQPTPAPVSKHRAWTAAFAFEMLPLCGDNLARTIAWLLQRLRPQNGWDAEPR